MRKTIALLTAALMAAYLAGCGSESGSIDTDDVAISQYKGVEIEEVEKPEDVTDDDVDEYIAAMVSENPIRTEVTDRDVKDGDIVNIDYVGTMDGEEFDGGSAEGYELSIGSGTFIDGFEDSVIGHKPGDTYDWNGAFPDDYSEDLAGKDVTFTITVNSIIDEEDAELNDEFVQGVSDTSTTVDEYKDEVREYLEKENESNYESSMQSAAWEAVLDNTTVKHYDEEKVQELIDQYIEQYKTYAEYYGEEYEDFIQDYLGYESEDSLKQDLEDSARSYLKNMMVADAIADKEHIKSDDYDADVDRMAELMGYSSGDDLKEAASEEELEDAIREMLVMEWVADNCEQTPAAEIDDLESSSSEDE